MTQRHLAVCFVLLAATIAGAQQGQSPQNKSKRNVIIFVADGLRYGSVNEKDTPALYQIRTRGVNFRNSYSVFPTFTTANASAIATGHELGDTGDFSNTIYVGFPMFDTGNFNRGAGTPVPFIESNEILADLDAHKNGNYLNESTLLEVARQNGFNTAMIGKLGPVAIQDPAAISPQSERFPIPPTIVIDDATSYDPVTRQAQGIPLPQELVERMAKLEIPLDAPARNNGFAERSPYNNANAGSLQRPGTLRANDLQQNWFVEVTTRAVLPMFAESRQPFVLLFWSRDPDGTQHNQGDSLNQLIPGINGPTSRLGVQNSDHSLQGILQWLDAHPEIKANTDLFVTSDHGFSTISRRELERTGTPTKAQSARHFYYSSTGELLTNRGYLPNGCLAIDLAWSLQTKLWDPGAPSAPGSRNPYKQVRLNVDEFYAPTDNWESPVHGNGLLGENVLKADGSDATAIVAANGGSDLIYVPDGSKETVERIVQKLLRLDYVDGIFVDDKYGKLPGTLPLSAIGLVGSAVMPRPAIAVAFKVFYLNPGDLMTGVQLSDTNLQEGQGNHGGFGREVTWNNMAAIGPDFKAGYEDPVPVSNTDIAPTLAKILGLKMPANGKLQGRVIDEALRGGASPAAPQMKSLAADPGGENNVRTVLFFQEFNGKRYFDSACMTSAKTIEPGMCARR